MSKMQKQKCASLLPHRQHQQKERQGRFTKIKREQQQTYSKGSHIGMLCVNLRLVSNPANTCSLAHDKFMNSS